MIELDGLIVSLTVGHNGDAGGEDAVPFWLEPALPQPDNAINTRMLIARPAQTAKEEPRTMRFM